MPDNSDALGFARSAHLDNLMGRLKDKGGDKDSDEESCLAFGFLRGLRERGLAVEFRFRTGDSVWLAYSCLVCWRHNPSAGLLLKFSTGDVVTLVLIRGSNLDMPVGQGLVNLTDRGFQRHRIVWVREMDELELRKAGAGQPTVDRIEVAEFESQEELQVWLKKAAPAFLRQGPRGQV